MDFEKLDLLAADLGVPPQLMVANAGYNPAPDVSMTRRATIEAVADEMQYKLNDKKRENAHRVMIGLPPITGYMDKEVARLSLLTGLPLSLCESICDMVVADNVSI